MNYCKINTCNYLFFVFFTYKAPKCTVQKDNFIITYLEYYNSFTIHIEIARKFDIDISYLSERLRIF